MIAFKEWALVCDSLLRGETSVILRKGGIAEGRDGFRFKHDEFLLFPTYFHEQIEKTRLNPDRDLARDSEETVTIRGLVRVESTRWIDDLDALASLEHLHVLKSEVIRERFRYEGKFGLHLAFVRAYALNEPWVLPFKKSYGGCRSWVELPDLPEAYSFHPVLQRDVVRR
jgi:hypothetical protein